MHHNDYMKDKIVHTEGDRLIQVIVEVEFTTRSSMGINLRSY